MTTHELAERTSLALHQAVAERLRADPLQVDRARARVEDALRTGSTHRYYAERWLELLSGPLETLCAVLVSTTEEATALRQTTPFAGVLDPATRWRIWRGVREGGRP